MMMMMIRNNFFIEFPSSLSSGNEIASGSGQDDTIGPMLLRLQQLKGEEEALDQDLSFLSESISQTCSKSTRYFIHDFN